MSLSKTLILRTSQFITLPSPNSRLRVVPVRPSSSLSVFSPNPCTRTGPVPFASSYGTLTAVQGVAALPLEDFPASSSSESPLEDPTKDTVEQLLTTNRDDVARLMKMERRCTVSDGEESHRGSWFPYVDKFRYGDVYLSSREVLEAVGPHMMEERKERFRHVVKNRSFSVCLVVEGLSDFGNVSATFRSADALGFQSVHVVSCDISKRCL